MRNVFKIGETLQVFVKGKTSNEKIEGDRKAKIVQSYTFSRKQFELVKSGDKISMQDFFDAADSNCLDCPLRSFGKCYTHKPIQYSGFLSMLRSISRVLPTWDLIPNYTAEIAEQIVNNSADVFVRFGSYGEPSVHPTELIDNIVKVAKSHTGYTHQWRLAPELNKHFTASVHTAQEETLAKGEGWRSFIATPTPLENYVNCPASKEQNYKSNCSKCGLCSGSEGKGNKSVYILNH